ncbi:hypothetical protein BP5796_08209 [Coleophoma crateriformis]|uniref:Xylanolytic transcriptional activator regulatory domain-containing protein n=1 Tax=Coleophoma crateriformis TaxID=565419 RepID=A0A3D8RDQ8_9HELO|nr:hypothetical protein BP5796_08209 [Coleophoma crateriformis]
MATDTHDDHRLGLSNEIGSLTTAAQGGSQFVGSSSGVFFVNTVRRAFANSAPRNTLERTISLSRGTSPERFIGGNDDSQSADVGIPRAAVGLPREVGEQPSATKRPFRLPPYDTAKLLVMTYFKCWHPLFPILHGPSFMQEFDSLYHDNEDLFAEQQQNRHVTVLRCIFSIACLEHPDVDIPSGLVFQTPGNLISILAPLALQNDVIAIQTLLVAQLYLFATMSLKAAASVGGLLWKSIFHTGLHRCPYRYEKISAHDRDIRKRVFWSAYSLDRFLSQALGHPLGIQDSDIDVCHPGQQDLHEPVQRHKRRTLGNSPDDTVFHLPDGHPAKVVRGESEFMHSRDRESSSVMFRDAEIRIENEKSLLSDGMAQKRRDRQYTQGHFVSYGKLTGRTVEIYHKSITERSASSQLVLSLKTDIDKWWNDLPPALSDMHSRDRHDWTTDQESRRYDLAALFTVLNDNLTLLVNRPALSLEPSKAEFQASLQICIRSARNIIVTLQTQLSDQESLFWPGYMSSAWMAGLIIAFACQLKTYSISKGLSDIATCLKLLNELSKRWPLARQCHSALEQLLLGLEARQQLSWQKRPLGSRIFNDVTPRNSYDGGEETRRAKRTRHNEDRTHDQDETPTQQSYVNSSLDPTTKDYGSNELSTDGTGAPVSASRLESINDDNPQQYFSDDAYQLMDIPSQSYDGLELPDLFTNGVNDMFESITWESLNNDLNG